MLGISRQMLNFVRSGERKFSEANEEKLDDLLSSFQTMTTPANLPPEAAAEHLPQTPTPPSAEAMELLQELYDLIPPATNLSAQAYTEADTSAMAVPGLVLNFISLVRGKEADTALLGRLATLLHLIHIGITSDRSQLRLAKSILDDL